MSGIPASALARQSRGLAVWAGKHQTGKLCFLNLTQQQPAVRLTSSRLTVNSRAPQTWQAGWCPRGRLTAPPDELWPLNQRGDDQYWQLCDPEWTSFKTNVKGRGGEGWGLKLLTRNRLKVQPSKDKECEWKKTKCGSCSQLAPRTAAVVLSRWIKHSAVIRRITGFL